MPLLSDATITQQNEWATQLGGSVAELQSVATDACRHYDGYLAALMRMGELYAHCGRLMVQANAPVLAAPHRIESATDARKVAAQLKLSMEQWQGSSDEVALRAFLQNQREQWQMWDSEVRKSFEHNKKRQVQCNTIDALRKRIKQLERKSPGTAKAMQEQLKEVQAERTQLDMKVQHDIEEEAKLCSKDLIAFGTKFVDLMSKSGQMCAVSFQPIAFSGDSLSPTRTTSSFVGSPTVPTDTVLGVVLDRPSPREEASENTDAADMVSYTRSYVYQHDDSVGSPTLTAGASSLYRDPSTAQV